MAVLKMNDINGNNWMGWMKGEMNDTRHRTFTVAFVCQFQKLRPQAHNYCI